MTKPAPPPKKKVRRPVIWVALGSLGLTIVLTTIPDSAWEGFFGQLTDLWYQGFGGPRLIPTIVVSAVCLCCFWVFFRGLLEDIGLLKNKEEWQDWRDEPLPVPDGADSQPQKKARSTNNRLLEKEPWTHRGSIRRLRGKTARKHWGYNNDDRVK